jgi:hypothetical protein
MMSWETEVRALDKTQSPEPDGAWLAFTPMRTIDVFVIG